MNSKLRPTFLLLFVSLLLVIGLQISCRSDKGAEGTQLLPKAQPGEQNFSKYQPDRPYSELAPGVLTRTLHEAAGQNGYRLEVRDLLVGAGQSASNVSLPGAAVFEVRSGHGTVTAAGNRQEVTSGATFALSDGETFSVENKSDEPIAFRVHLFIAT